MAHQSTFDTLTIAQSYIDAGLSIIPITPGTKKPDPALLPKVYDEAAGETRPSWRMFQERQAYPREVDRWFARTNAGIGIVGGAVSGGLVVIDLETVEAYDQWRTNAVDLLGDDLISTLPVVATGKGRHVYFRMADAIGNRKLARIGKTVMAETRGEGGYVLAPPSVHPTGAIYELISGSLAGIPQIDPDQAQCVLDAARALTPTQPHPAGSTRQGSSVIDAFNQAHTIDSILEDHGYRAERAGRYIRPGGERSSVVVRDGKSVHFNSNDPLYREAPGGGNYSHTAFSAWCLLEHNDDVKAAVKAAAQALGIQRQPADDQALLAQAGRALGLGQDLQIEHGEHEDELWPYFIHEGGIWMHQTASDGTPKVPLLLTNFTAAITGETSRDDGEHTEDYYTITAACGRRRRKIDMLSTDFEGDAALGRIVAALGAKARVNPKAQARYVLDAIKALSNRIEEQTIYTHTGWVAGRYMFCNGYIDAAGWHPATGDTATWCHLPQRLERYRLHPTGSMSEALDLFDCLLDLAPSSVMVPLVGGVLLAPIAHALAPAPMIHVYGPTGSHKTSICCAAMALLGDFTPAHPTDTWTSTANSVQRLGWHLKDAPMLLDDYKAANVKPNQVTFLLQNYGDGMARGRLDANSEARAAYPIRGVLISSGEDQPEGEASILARILSVDLPRGAVHRGRLTDIQAASHELHQLTVAFFCWLAGQDVTAAGRQTYQRTRAAILSRLEETDHATNPGRVASNVATLHVAWDTFGQFLVQRGHWSTEKWQGWEQTCKKDLLNLARRQIELTTGERYSQIFLDAVQGLLASGKAILHDTERQSQEMLTSQVLIGARDKNGIYLIAQTAYDEVCKHYRSAGKTVGFTLRALSQLLDQDGLLVTKQAPSLVVRKRVNGIPAWCWHLPTSLLDS